MIILVRFLVFLFFILNIAFGSNVKEMMKTFFTLYKTGSYIDAIEIGNKIKSKDMKIESTRLYLLGLCYNKSNQYKKSTKAFYNSIKLRNDSEDVFYEYGQALFSINELEKARKAFSYSFRKRFKTDSSLYYMGYISQLLEEYKKAGSYYLKLIQRGINYDLIPIAYLQTGEMYLSINKEKEDIKNIVEFKVIPTMEKGIQIAKQEKVISDIQKRIDELKQIYKIGPNILDSGRVLDKDRFKIYISQSVKNDTNILSSTDELEASATKRHSTISDTTLSMDYRYINFRKWIIKPEVSYHYIYHLNRHEEVISSDGYDISGFFNNKLEHTFLGSLSYLIFNVGYVYAAKDINAKETFEEYSQSYTFTLSEEMNIFEFGSTTFKFTYDLITSYNTSLSGSTIGFSFTQIKKTKTDKIWINVLSYNSGSFKDSTNNTVSYKWRINFLAPSWFLDFKAGHALTILDTMEQSDERGTEATFNPYLSLSKNITKSFNISISYDYIYNLSKDKQNYDYSKSIYGANMGFNF